jgi:two-component system cell cycle response regulator
VKVLIADDEAVTRKVLQTTLEDWGYEVMVAQDGNEAWGILQRDDTPLLVILDWYMPVMSGLQLVKTVRASIKSPYVYIIMLTIKDEKKDIVEALEAGADDYISKPFDAEELRVRLRAGQRIVELQEQLWKLAQRKVILSPRNDPTQPQ